MLLRHEGRVNAIAELEAERDRLRAAIRAADDLLDGVPSGVDEAADISDPSPGDMVAHVGGLIRQALRQALE